MTTKRRKAQTNRLASKFMSGAHEIPQVAASETGRAQTRSLRAAGVADLQKRKTRKGKQMGNCGKESETLVPESASNGQESRVPRDTRNLVGSRVDHHPRLHTTERPIEDSTVRER